MSIFSKQMRNLGYDDIEELQVEGSSENIRLEFKRGDPSKDEMMKKLSSFANTYGGYVVIGVAEDGNGNLKLLDGVDPIRGYNQRLVHWCYDNIYPPITPVVSNPIPLRDNPSKVFYVIYVEESHETPHFLNGRKGCYIRTHEFSQPFEPRLATYEEIQHLANRRQRAVELREGLIKRARDRFDAHVRLHYRKHINAGVGRDIDATFSFAIVPSFPGISPLAIGDLQNALSTCRIRARHETFPMGTPLSQHECFFFDNPRLIDFSYFEANIHRLLFYTQEVGRIETPGVIIYTTHILAWILFYLEYSRKFYEYVGYEGSLRIEVGLDRIKERRIQVFSVPYFTSPMLDEAFNFHRETFALALDQQRDDVAKELYRTLCFACGWSAAFAADDALLERHLNEAYRYLGWKRS